MNNNGHSAELSKFNFKKTRGVWTVSGYKYISYNEIIYYIIVNVMEMKYNTATVARARWSVFACDPDKDLGARQGRVTGHVAEDGEL